MDVVCPVKNITKPINDKLTVVLILLSGGGRFSLAFQPCSLRAKNKSNDYGHSTD